MRLVNEIVFNAVDSSVPQASVPIQALSTINCVLQSVFTGSPNGTLKVQVSADNPVADATFSNGPVSTWSDLFSTQASVTSSGDVLYTGFEIGWAWMRLVWTPIGGSSGSITSRFNGKGLT